MRADARKNREQILAVARDVVADQGATASLRDIARRADVGLGTLYRHFPSREDLLEALLHASFRELVTRANELDQSETPDQALIVWLQEIVEFSSRYRGVTEAMMSAINDEDSALHESCTLLRSAGARLLQRSQAEGSARTDLDGTELFALISALAWLGDQVPTTARADRLFEIIVDAIVERRPTESR